MSVTVNGQVYAAWEDVPAYLRAILEKQFPDRDGSGIPDIFEGNVAAEPKA
ncbi:MAG: hypothetical protein ACR2K3_09020 [Nocardioides sp.]